MTFLFRRVDEGFDRLQTLLLNLRAGDAVSVDEAVQISGLSDHFCRAALEALTQVGVLVQEDESRFVRRALDAAAKLGVSSQRAG